MKITLTTGFTFTPATRRLDVSGIAGFDIKRLLGVMNLTRSTMMYAPATSGLGFSAYAAGVITLIYDTRNFASDDVIALLYDSADPQAVKSTPGVAVTQSYVAVPAYNAADASGAGGSNATIAQVLPANPNRAFLAIDNNGAADAELWFGAAPASGSVGQTIRRGKVVFANGGGLFRDAKVETGAIYATAAAATGLSVVEG